MATVEVTSEDPQFAVEAAFQSHSSIGWRASQDGKQQLRIIFDEPTTLHRIAALVRRARGRADARVHHPIFIIVGSDLVLSRTGLLARGRVKVVRQLSDTPLTRTYLLSDRVY